MFNSEGSRRLKNKLVSPYLELATNIWADDSKCDLIKLLFNSRFELEIFDLTFSYDFVGDF